MVKQQLFLFLAVVFYATLAQGQSTSVGFSVGPTISDLRAVDGSSFLKDIHKQRIGMAAEANLTWRFAKNFGVRTGFGFERKGAKSDIVFTDENGEPINESTIKTNLDYLQLPLLFEVRWGKRATWLFNIGQSYCLLVGNNEAHRLGGVEFVKTDWLVLAGMGLEFPIMESLKLQVQTRVAYGLNELVKEATWETKNFSTALTFGLQHFLN